MRNVKGLHKVLKKTMIFMLAFGTGMGSFGTAQKAEAEEDRHIAGGYITSQFDYDTPVVSMDGMNLYWAMESVYDPSEALPTVRNQSPHGVCWAFSTTTLAEFPLYKRTSTQYDFSEEHLAYFTLNQAEDPLGLTAGDINAMRAGKSDTAYLDCGGNYELATEALLNWKGEADETVYPYKGYKNYTEEDAFNDVAHVQNVYRVHIDSNRLLAKMLIKQYGALGVAYCDEDAYYSGTYNSYYHPEAGVTNHAVCIVGWDDTFPKENFSSSAKPAGNGAWLIRNSWGRQGKNHYGYFWMSYYDASLTDTGYIVDAVSQGEDEYYEHNYYHDGSHNSVAVSLSSGQKAANVFKVATDKEEIKAIGVELDSANTSYTVSLYKLNDDYSDPEDGVLLESFSGTTVYAGYYTIPLEESVFLNKGDIFSVEITLPEGGKIVSEGSNELYPDYHFVAVSEPRISFVGKAGYAWSDYGTQYNQNFRIKAYTNTVTEEATVAVTGVSITSDRTEMNIGDAFLMTAKVAPANATNRKLRWSSSKPEIATVSDGGYITPLSAGTTTITVTTLEGGFSDSLEITVTGLETSVSFCYNTGNITGSYKLKPEETVECAIITSPSNQMYHGRDVQWSVENTEVAEIDDNGVLTAKAAGETIVHAVFGELMGQCNVFVAMNVSAVSRTDGAIDINWDKYIGADGYILSLGYASGSPELTNLDKETVTRTIQNPLEAGRGYPKEVRVWIEKSGKPGLSYSTEVQYRIDYVLDGGNNHADNKTKYTYRDVQYAAMALGEPEKPGYVFRGWYTDENLTQPYGNEIPKGNLGNLKLFAKWEPATFTVKYDKNGSYVIGTMEDSSFTCASTAPLRTNNYSNAGYDFVGWNTQADGNGMNVADGAIGGYLSSNDGETVTLYAQWKMITYSISYILDGGKNSAGNPATYNVESSKIILEEPVRSGYLFEGWYTGADFSQSVTEIPARSTKNLSLRAKWRENRHQISFDVNGADSSLTPSDMGVIDGQKLGTLPRVSRTGYEFLGWYTAAKGGTEVTGETICYEDAVIYAHWQKTEYTLTYNVNGGNTLNPTSKSVEMGSKYGTLPTPTRTDYEFLGWYTAASGGSKVTADTVCTGNATIYAQWKEGKKPEGEPQEPSEPALTPENNYDGLHDYRYTIPVSQAGQKVASYQGIHFYEDSAGKKRCYKENGVPVVNEFKCDGTYTYYFQLDGTCMTDRLSYHPDGIHVIYFDHEGHEVFSNFANVRRSISGDAVDDYCFFDVFGYLYVDVVTFDQTGTKLYYANEYGVMSRGAWFKFSDSVKWADGTPFDKAGGEYGYATEDGSLMINQNTYDWEGRPCRLQGNGVALY